MLRVAFVFRALPKYRIPLYRRLLARGHLDFGLYCQRFDLPARQLGYSEAPRDSGLPVNWYRMPAWSARVSNRLGVGLPASPRLLLDVARYAPDVVVLDSLSNVGSNLMLALWLRHRRVPFVFWSLGAIPRRSRSLRARVGDFVQSCFARRASACLTYSTHGRGVLVRLGADPESTFVVYNTLDEVSIQEDIARCHPQVDTLRESLGLAARPVLIFVGTINPGKRLDLLIQAMALLKHDPAIRTMEPCLLVVGDGPALPTCRKLVGELGLTGRDVYFVGRQERDVSAYLLLADFMVLPGLGGLAINHAFAHSLPVICGSADGCEIDLVQTGVTGIRLDEVTPEVLAGAVASLVNDPGLTSRMGQTARDLVCNRFTLERFVATVERAAFHAAGFRAPPDVLAQAHALCESGEAT